MPLLSMVSLLSAASLTGLSSEPAPPALNPAAEPIALHFAPAPQGMTQQRAVNLNVIIGQRTLEDDLWEPNDEQFTVGLEMDTYRRDQFIGLDAGFHYGDDDTGGGFGQTTEVFLGARKTFSLGQTDIHPYLAVGASYIWATNGVSQPPNIVAEQDSSLGLYGRGGVYWTLGDMLNVGVDVRALVGTDIEAFGADTADYVQIAALIGWSM